MFRTNEYLRELVKHSKMQWHSIATLALIFFSFFLYLFNSRSFLWIEEMQVRQDEDKHTAGMGQDTCDSHTEASCHKSLSSSPHTDTTWWQQFDKSQCNAFDDISHGTYANNNSAFYHKYHHKAAQHHKPILHKLSSPKRQPLSHTCFLQANNFPHGFSHLNSLSKHSPLLDFPST